MYDRPLFHYRKEQYIRARHASRIGSQPEVAESSGDGRVDTAFALLILLKHKHTREDFRLWRSFSSPAVDTYSTYDHRNTYKRAVGVCRLVAQDLHSKATRSRRHVPR